MNLQAVSEGVHVGAQSARSGAERWLKDFEDHLSRVQGLALSSRRSYCFFARRFLAGYCGTAAPDWTSLRGEDLAMFVHRESSRLKRYARRGPATAIRALLRYLVFVGAIRGGLEAAIPRMPRWTHAAVPRYLPAAEVERVVAGVLADTPKGRRDRAILLLLARMGLRAVEVAQLTLEDINWQEGNLWIRSDKSHRERRLPLPKDVGAALCAYLEHGRPRCTSRTVFLRVLPPFDPLRNSAAVCKIARRALTRAGVSSPAAAHLFRHSSATRMIRSGASFKQIADVLGHASLKTTAIYAKLDLGALSRVSLPWPENAP
jgi:integrase/recombinase XerD